VAAPLLVASAELTAFTVTTWLAGIAEGAVYKPAAVIVPAVADHVTAVLAVPVTVAPNCRLAPSASEVFDGFTVTVIGGGGAAPTVRLIELLAEAPFPGLVTLNLNVPATDGFPVAFSAVLLMYVVIHTTPPT
jgi:hypothetical protein